MLPEKAVLSFWTDLKFALMTFLWITESDQDSLSVPSTLFVLTLSPNLLLLFATSTMTYRPMLSEGLRKQSKYRTSLRL